MKIDLCNKTILITGAAGFIGASLSEKLLNSFQDITIIGMDNMNPYYDVKLKEFRLKRLKSKKNFIFLKGDISEKDFVFQVFEQYCPDLVVNLAAQAGVRYSLTCPDTYIQSNITGFFHILEACRRYKEQEGVRGVKHLVYASSSSVYGAKKEVPYSTEDKTDWPVSLYAATKKSNELMAYSYSKLYQINATGLRFFTVYGPAGRPDMAYFKFTDRLVRGEKIELYNYGDMYRDFTYIDDITEGITRIMQKTPHLAEQGAPHYIYNIGNHHPVSLKYFVEILEKCLIKTGIIQKAGEKELLPMQAGDVYQTYADVRELVRDFGFQPQTELEEGLLKFSEWYKEYFLIPSAQDQ